MSKEKRKIWILLIISIVVLGIVTQVLPKVVNKVKATKIAEFGELSVKDEVSGIVLRKEHVYVAGSDVDVTYKVDEGTLVKAKSSVVTYKESDKPKNKSDSQSEKKSPISERLGDAAIPLSDGIASEKGTFSTFIDGYEGKMTPDNYKDIDIDTLDKLDAKVENVKSSSIKKGYPVYKLIDQSEWYIVAWVDNKKLSRYKVNQDVNIYFSDSEEKEKPVKFTIKDISDAGKKSRVLLSSNRSHPEFEKLRKVNIAIETVSISGVIVDNKSIVEKGDKSGVYVVSKTGEEIFKEIKILGSDGEKSAIVENIFYDADGNLVKTVKIFDEIIENPKKK